GIEIAFHAPPGGCAVDFSIDDVSLVRVRPGAAIATFDTGLDGFIFGQYDDPSAQNLALARDAGAPATLAWDSTQGDPAPGSLKVTAPYSAFYQYVDVQKNFDS